MLRTRKGHWVAAAVAVLLAGSPAVSAAATPSTSAPPPCSTANAHLSTSRPQSLMSNAAIAVHVVATRPCVTTGYPDVVVLDATGQKSFRPPQQLAGYLGGHTTSPTPPTVVLQAGQEATALVEYGDVARYDGHACPAWVALRVTLPDTHGARRLDVGFTTCRATVSVNPLIAGSTGGD